MGIGGLWWRPTSPLIMALMGEIQPQKYCIGEGLAMTANILPQVKLRCNSKNHYVCIYIHRREGESFGYKVWVLNMHTSYASQAGPCLHRIPSPSYQTPISASSTARRNDENWYFMRSMGQLERPHVVVVIDSFITPRPAGFQTRRDRKHVMHLPIAP